MTQAEPGPSDSWPPGGLDPLLNDLQQLYLPELGRMDMAGLLNDTQLGRLCVVSSFGAESVVLLHWLSRIRPGLPVLFLETGMHFSETLDYARRLSDSLDLDLRMIAPEPGDLAQEDPRNMLWQSDPDSCCRIRKVFPLQDALADFDSWISGRKRFQASTRSALPVLERDGRLIKINPLAIWTAEEVAAYVAEHDLPSHPLTARGYPSIGCRPCTQPAADGADPRSGRWSHSPDKTECGIHLGPDGRFRRSGQDTSGGSHDPA